MSSTRTPAERRAIVSSFHRSGLSQVAFARTVGISQTTLHRYLREGGPVVLPARIVEDTPAAPTTVELEVCGVRARVLVGTDVDYVASLLAAVRRC